MAYRVGIDLGGTKMRMALALSGGEIIAARNYPTVAKQGPDAILRMLRQRVDELLHEAGCNHREVDGLGLCVAGFYNNVDDVMVSSPNLPGWEGIHLAQVLRRQFGFPLIVENDANAAAYGEARHGAGRGFKNMLLLTLGTGIGGGLLLNEKLFRGDGGFAGEIGHIPLLPNGPPCGCGRFGCLEALASGTAIAREGRNILVSGDSPLLKKLVSNSAELEAADVFAAARLGDEPACRIIEQAAFFLGQALAIVVNILNPGIIILSGGMADNLEQFFAPMRNSFNAAVLTPAAAGLQIVGGQLGGDAGIRGILSLLAESPETEEAAAIPSANNSFPDNTARE